MAKQKVKASRKTASGAVAALPSASPGGAETSGKRKLRAKGATGSAEAVSRRGKHAGKAKSKIGKRDATASAGASGGLAASAQALATLVRKKLPRPATRPSALERLETAIAEVRDGSRLSPRTRRLQAAGLPKMAQKVIEEAGEVAIEALQGNHAALVNETVDLFYNTLVLLSAAGVSTQALWAEMERREEVLGMAEKLPKTNDPDA